MTTRARSTASAIRAVAVVAAVTVAGCAAVGCRPRPPLDVAVDLATAWPSALVAVEPHRIDLGTETARRFLRAGWYYDERASGTGDTFVWSRGDASELELHLGWRRDLVIRISGRPFDYPGAAPQTLSFELNGRPVAGPVTAPRSGAELRVELPADAQSVGANRLVVRYGRVDAPADVVPDSTDRRRLAFAWSELRLDGVDPTEPGVRNGTVTMPGGARADHFVELRPGSVLRIDGCEPLGPAHDALIVATLDEHGRRTDKAVDRCDDGPLELRLGDHDGLTRVRLATRPTGDADRPVGLRLRLPRILSPAVEDRPGPAPAAIAARDTVRGSDRPNVVVYLVDALRADRLGVYGCPRPLSPHLDAMAADGITFTDVTAQSSWTKAAVASIFTGRWPRAHGVNGPDDRIPDRLATLPEMLRSAGYRTGAVVANAYVGRAFGFARGFDHFEFLDHRRGRSEVIHRRLEHWFGDRGDDDAPFFLYVHTIDPHAPYAPPPRFRDRFAAAVEDPGVGQVDTVRGLVLGTVEPSQALGRDLRLLYDGEVAANDASFGRMLDLLRRTGELDETVVIFTSDHGEAFGEHGSWTHGLDLYNEVLAVPLVIRLPGAAGAGRRVTAPVQHTDLAPTILRLCGVETAAVLEGSVLVDRDGTPRVGEDRAIHAYLDYWDRSGAAVLRDGWKLIRPLSADFGSAIELYRRPEDPAETADLAGTRPVRRGWLEAQLDLALRDRGASQTTEVAPEIREQLEALGYMH